MKTFATSAEAIKVGFEKFSKVDLLKIRMPVCVLVSPGIMSEDA